MSQNLDAKDKLKISFSGKDADGKLVIDPSDGEGLMEHFSRMAPGDEATGTFKCTLDEAGQKTVVLSITELTVDKNEDDETPKKPKEDDEDSEEEGEEPAAVTLAKNGDGVPEQEGNETPDNSAQY